MSYWDNRRDGKYDERKEREKKEILNKKNKQEKQNGK